MINLPGAFFEKFNRVIFIISYSYYLFNCHKAKKRLNIAALPDFVFGEEFRAATSALFEHMSAKILTPPGKCDRILRYGGIAKWLRQRTLTPSPLVQIQLPLPKSSRGAPRVPLLLFDRGSKDGAVACVQASWFTFTARRSASSLARRRARESSSQTNTQLPQII